MNIVELSRTCIACPSQWEGRTDDDRPVYIRFRHSVFTFHVGPTGGTIEDAVDSEPIFASTFAGDGHDGLMYDETLRKLVLCVVLDVKYPEEIT